MQWHSSMTNLESSPLLAMRCNMFWRASLEASFSGVINRILMDATVEEKDIAESFLKTALLSSEDWMEDRKATGMFIPSSA